MNKRLLLSIASVAASSALVVGATFAFFSDSGTSNDNVFAAGTLDLKLSDVGESMQDSVSATWGDSDMAPGDCTTATLNLRNSGTVPANHVDISITNTNDDMDDYLRLNTLTYDTVDQLGSITDSQANTFKDLQDFESDQLVSLGLTNLGTDHPLVMEVCLDGSAPNSLQGASDTMVMTVFLDQGLHP